MTKRIALSVVLLSFVATATVATAAGSLTDLVQASRMTVAAVDRSGGRFLCVEHHQWLSVAEGDLTGIRSGDIVRVEARNDRAAHVAVLRTAAEEISSPER